MKRVNDNALFSRQANGKRAAPPFCYNSGQHFSVSRHLCSILDLIITFFSEINKQTFNGVFMFSRFLAALCSELSCGNFCHLGRKLIMPQVIRPHFLSLHSIVNFCFLFNVPLNIFIHLLPRDHISVPGYPKS